MSYFIDSFMQHRRQQWLRAIHAVEVQAGGKWHRGHINQKEINGDTIVIKATFPDLDSEACTITAFQVIDVRGEVASYQQRTVQKHSGQGTMIKIAIPIHEATGGNESVQKNAMARQSGGR